MAGYIDLKIDNKTNDLVAQNGVLVWESGAMEVLNRIRTRLRLIRGEWFLNTQAGIPYFDEVLGRKDTGIFNLLIRQCILETEGVQSIYSFNRSIDYLKRKTIYKINVVIADRIYELDEEL
jgi:hypothetical protein